MAEYEPDKTFISASKLKKLTDRGCTPFFLYDEDGIRQSCRFLQNQFSWQPGFQNYFPIRENINPTILKLLLSCGLGALACGKAELLLAQKCGFHGGNLLYEPMMRDYDAEKLALELDAGWLVNSPHLLPMQRVPSILLRYHPLSARACMGRPNKSERSKNGFTEPQLMETIRLLHVRGVASIGLALDVASSGFQPGFYAARASALFRLLPEIQKRTGVTIGACCLGDGFAPSYRPNLPVPTLEDETVQIKLMYETLPEGMRPRLSTALSKQLLERNGILVTKVLEIRELSRNTLVVDASVCQYLRPALKQAYRHISLLGKNQTEKRKRYQIVGYLPEEFDRFGEGRMLPEAETGDICILHDVGCGGRSMPMLYAMQPPCAEYLFCVNGQIQQIGAAPTETQVLDFLTTW